MKRTNVGVLRSMTVLSPSAPNSSDPQHFRLPSFNIAQVWSFPRAIPVTYWSVVPTTSIVVSTTREANDVPSPHWPWLLRPKHLTVLSSASAQEWSSPNEICSIEISDPKSIVVGNERLSESPVPSFPYYWLLPQHFTILVLFSAFATIAHV